MWGFVIFSREYNVMSRAHFFSKKGSINAGIYTKLKGHTALWLEPGSIHLHNAVQMCASCFQPLSNIVGIHVVLALPCTRLPVSRSRVQFSYNYRFVSFDVCCLWETLEHQSIIIFCGATVHVCHELEYSMNRADLYNVTIVLFSPDFNSNPASTPIDS